MAPKRSIRLQLLWVVAGVIVRGIVPLLWLLNVIRISPRWAGRLVVIDSVLLLWVLYSWWVTRQRFWCWLAALLLVALLTSTFLATDHPGGVIAVIGVACMSLCFVIGHWVICAVLSPGVGVFGVARTLVDEAVRMKVVMAFIMGLLFVVPVLPFVLDPNELLKYRIQIFLTWSLSGSSLLLSLMTVLLACGTICGEVSGRQIFLTLTKPIGRGQYLLGKWLGIVMLDLLLVGVVGIGVYAFAKVLQQQPERDKADRDAIERQILVARQAVAAQPPAGMDLSVLVAKHLEQLQSEIPRPHRRSQPQPTVSRMVQQAVVAKWHTIAPRGDQTYRFTNLQRARRYGQNVQLRFKPVSSMTPPDERVRLAIWLNGRPHPTDAGRHLPIVVADNRYHVIDLPVSEIDEDGDLEVRIANVDLDHMRATFPSSISFSPRQGLEVLYQVGRFEPNLVRALVLIWLQLGFLAMLGLTAGSFVGFPVACLLCMLVYVTGAAKGFLLESMQHYVPFPAGDLSWWDRLVWVPKTFLDLLLAGEIWSAVKILIRIFGNTFVLMIPSFGHYDPVSLVADGRQVRSEMLRSAAGSIGVAWTGSCALVGWLVFRRRELARVTV